MLCSNLTASLCCLLAIALALSMGVENVDHDVKQSPEERLAIPVIDLTPWLDKSHDFEFTAKQQEIVNQVREACQTIGFFQITGTTLVDPAILQHAYEASRDFFGLPMEEKLLLKSTPDYPYGYEQSEVLARGKHLDENTDCDNCGQDQQPDTKETFALGPPDEKASGMPPRKWSSTSHSDFRVTLEKYYHSMEDLALTLLQIVALALEESPDFFENKMDHHMSALRLLHYDPQEGASHKEHIRAGAHTDYGALTILAAQQEGLQVLLPDENDGMTWHNVPVIPGAFVVNLGDLMQRWTNGQWVSTMHRVVTVRERYSMAYFVNINGDTPIQPLKCCSDGIPPENKPILTAREHLMAKHLASMGMEVEM